MDLLSKLKGLSYLGARNIAAAVRYAVRRDRMERPVAASRKGGKTQTPGQLVGVKEALLGGTLRFAEAELEVAFLAPDLVRLTWQPGTLPVPYAVVEGDWAQTDVACSTTPDGGARFVTEGMTVTVGPAGGVTFATPGGARFHEDDAPRRTGESWALHSRGRDEEAFFGLGERTAPADLRGHSFRLWNREPKGAYGPTTDPIYVSVPVYCGLNDAGSYLVFHENSNDGEVSFLDGVDLRFEAGALRYYVALGTPARLLDRYTALTGRPAMPPRWALGFHQARWSYMNEGEVRELVEQFERHDLPLSAIHLDIHYMDDYRVFTVNGERFPDLKQLAADVKAKGVELVAILDPGVKRDPDYALFREGMERDVFVKGPDGEPVVAPVWPNDCCFPDFTDPAVRDWWGEKYAMLVDFGIAGVWHDMNEPAAFAAWGDPTLPRNARHAMEGRGGDHVEGHNLYALLEARAGHEALRQMRPEARPWILSRSGYAGLQRYAWNWTGDNESNWWSLHQSVRIAIGLGLSGIPYTGPDIGGFGGKPGPELFTRWFQLGAFLPFFRIHSAFFTPRREPWCFGEETLGILREFLKLRYRLLPYLYTLAKECAETGAPLVRPLWWRQPDNTELRSVDDAYLLGDALLVAPITSEGATTRAVPLPPGEWIDFWTGEGFEGGGSIYADAPLDRIPLYVRAGTLLPMEQDGTLELHLFGAGEGRAPVYVDGGDGYGGGALVHFDLSREGDDRLVVTCGDDWPFPMTRGDGDGGDFPFPLGYREGNGGDFPFPMGARIVLHGLSATQVRVDGEPLVLVEGRADLPRCRRVEVPL